VGRVSEDRRQAMIHEFKIEETEDGYRIEIKGDKEQIKRLFEHGPFGMRMPFVFGFGPRHGHHGPRHWKKRGFHWKGNPWGHGPKHWGQHHEEDEGPSPYSV
jgi:hypothetical protein